MKSKATKLVGVEFFLGCEGDASVGEGGWNGTLTLTPTWEMDEEERRGVEEVVAAALREYYAEADTGVLTQGDIDAANAAEEALCASMLKHEEDPAEFRRMREEEAELEADKPCRHGHYPAHECNDCMVAADVAYDVAREDRMSGRGFRGRD